ncbi:bifunctional alpha,alpha-trehalose-phosphate synthase (UDP-forming)/trehalose-phosphatase [Gordonibacter sp. An230]|uniref:bifunctional alpha,alpha-trehalose-phosphate synthase (UDP-forming)/trehalose-phosphatase n=1 Tax=Gordonibacter sp. An230 TaxID=1965592 RepID=UPI000B391442|nr:bifunctional alpha,alpha-trehalose-phosphate synthase (UDP-forming)/trehalose-phosphatase [Gordonibacter sp. An230]OUO90449.1 bifunctional alpha,alpha-trehalose-phosphate synthase (UDP-forming)/trehalose-phosphatase [Gordonibacter sp. An230]
MDKTAHAYAVVADRPKTSPLPPAPKLDLASAPTPPSEAFKPGVAGTDATGRRLVIVSNRLPYRIEGDGTGRFSFERSVGGLSTGLGPLHEKAGNLWIGWADTDGSIENQERSGLESALGERACRPVFLDERDAQRYYEGFSNSAVWPLFHGFSHLARFDKEEWEAYRRVNERFRDAVVAEARPGDVLWVQDYHLMLLPSLLREALPDARIGFFLHIPFPDYETFRMLPWREEIVRGMLGADLIGFHAYDYVRHFLSSCRRVAGIENASGALMVSGRLVQADAFPLGIDYERYRDAARTPAVRRAAAEFTSERGHEGCKVMLSVERLDYSKGIPDRLNAYDAFLDRHPEWAGKVVLVLVTVPSRENVESYRKLKKRIDELVGLINGKHSTMDWTPVEYHYRSLPFDQLAGLYVASDIMLVTPLRDGMNLVCKEYLACHDGGAGVLVLSEMAGASSELHEAILVNPFDLEGMVSAMEQALAMPEDEQRRRNAPMQQRLARYTSQKWAREFLSAMDEAKQRQEGLGARLIGSDFARKLAEAFLRAQRRALLLDYDGTLAPFSNEPEHAEPDARLLELLRTLAAAKETDVVVVSGRDRATLETWLGGTPAELVAEHGAWFLDRARNGWTLEEPLDNSWKDSIRPVLADFVDRTPGAILEEKDFSLVWHYRMCGQELAERRVIELKNALGELAESGLALMDGNKVLEIKPSGVSKGHAARRWFCDPSYGFLLVAGDDRTDEDMFEAAPSSAWTVKVGGGPTRARFALRDCHEMRALLETLAKTAS